MMGSSLTLSDDVCSPPDNDRKSQEQSDKVISTANAKNRNLFSNLQPSSIESKRGRNLSAPEVLRCFDVGARIKVS